MANLTSFKDLLIDWDLTPEDAVTMYLEWGNNNWHSPHPPVRSKDDVSTYFVVDNWGTRPQVRLVRRNSDEAVDLATLDLPDSLVKGFHNEFGGLKGVFAPTDDIKRWLRGQLGH
ncbi:MAG: DVU0772 family protein [Desulfatibacillaceae bacterium]